MSQSGQVSEGTGTSAGPEAVATRDDVMQPQNLWMEPYDAAELVLRAVNNARCGGAETRENVIVLRGPTGSGKTTLAHRIATYFDQYCRGEKPEDEALQRVYQQFAAGQYKSVRIMSKGDDFSKIGSKDVESASTG